MKFKMQKFNLIVIFIIVIFKFSNATKVQTYCNGSWDDNSIWIGNQIPEKNDTIIIAHFITKLNTIVLDSNIVIVNKYGELCTVDKLVLNSGSKFYNYGKFSSYTIELADSFFNYGVLKTNLLVITNYLISENGGSINIGEYTCSDIDPCIPIIILDNDTVFSNITAFEYEWYLNNQNLYNNSRFVHVVNSGYYKVRIRKTEYENFSIFSDSLLVNLNSFGKINSNYSEFLLYPNPTDKVIKVFCQKTSVLYIQNINGKILFEKQLTIGNNEVELNHLSQGIYLFKVQNSKEVFSGKLIKQ